MLDCPRKLAVKAATSDWANLATNAAKRPQKKTRRPAKGNTKKHHPQSETTYHDTKPFLLKRVDCVQSVLEINHTKFDEKSGVLGVKESIHLVSCEGRWFSKRSSGDSTASHIRGSTTPLAQPTAPARAMAQRADHQPHSLRHVFLEIDDHKPGKCRVILQEFRELLQRNYSANCPLMTRSRSSSASCCASLKL